MMSIHCSTEYHQELWLLVLSLIVKALSYIGVLQETVRFKRLLSAMFECHEDNNFKGIAHVNRVEKIFRFA